MFFFQSVRRIGSEFLKVCIRIFPERRKFQVKFCNRAPDCFRFSRTLCCFADFLGGSMEAAEWSKADQMFKIIAPEYTLNL